MADRQNPQDYALAERESLTREDVLTAALIVLPFAILLALILFKL